MVLSLTLTFFRKKALLILIVFTVLSFIGEIIAVYLDAKFAFYLPFCRFWQMSIGGIIAFQNIKINTKYINEALSIIGTVGILVTVWIVNEQSLFPGFWALIPTLGAAFIIQAGDQSFVNKKILSSKLFVFIGKISYPLYLWHWPLLAISAYLYPPGSQSIFHNTYFVVFIAVVLSILTFYLVENRVRFKKKKSVVFKLLAMMALIGIIAMVFANTNVLLNE